MAVQLEPYRTIIDNFDCFFDHNKVVGSCGFVSDATDPGKAAEVENGGPLRHHADRARRHHRVPFACLPGFSRSRLGSSTFRPLGDPGRLLGCFIDNNTDPTATVGHRFVDFVARLASFLYCHRVAEVVKEVLADSCDQKLALFSWDLSFACAAARFLV